MCNKTVFFRKTHVITFSSLLWRSVREDHFAETIVVCIWYEGNWTEDNFGNLYSFSDSVENFQNTSSILFVGYLIIVICVNLYFALTLNNNLAVAELHQKVFIRFICPVPDVFTSSTKQGYLALAILLYI